jgi:hypothetical protein
MRRLGARPPWPYSSSQYQQSTNLICSLLPSSGSLPPLTTRQLPWLLCCCLLPVANTFAPLQLPWRALNIYNKIPNNWPIVRAQATSTWRLECKIPRSSSVTCIAYAELFNWKGLEFVHTDLNAQVCHRGCCIITLELATIKAYQTFKSSSHSRRAKHWNRPHTQGMPNTEIVLTLKACQTLKSSSHSRRAKH